MSKNLSKVSTISCLASELGAGDWIKVEGITLMILGRVIEPPEGKVQLTVRESNPYTVRKLELGANEVVERPWTFASYPG